SEPGDRKAPRPRARCFLSCHQDPFGCAGTPVGPAFAQPLGGAGRTGQGQAVDFFPLARHGMLQTFSPCGGSWLRKQGAAQNSSSWGSSRPHKGHRANISWRERPTKLCISTNSPACQRKGCVGRENG